MQSIRATIGLVIVMMVSGVQAQDLSPNQGQVTEMIHDTCRGLSSASGIAQHNRQKGLPEGRNRANVMGTLRDILERSGASAPYSVAMTRLTDTYVTEVLTNAPVDMSPTEVRGVMYSKCLEMLHQ